ncbi:MAG: hypothetical protein HQL37_13205 [Alphaproteobacteria bacterium]|nr:hypothetical protein [Alphaproteobacteria bacterium]
MRIVHTNSATTTVETREVVGVFGDRENFEKAIELLVIAGFQHGDLSILSSHEALEAAEPPGKSIREILLPFLSEFKYEVPLVAAGLIALASGPTAALIAGLVAAGLGGAALKEIVSEIVTMPHTEHFERALDAGSLILWVAVGDEAEEIAARKILIEYDASNIHLHVTKTPISQ